MITDSNSISHYIRRQVLKGKNPSNLVHYYKMLT